jgi:hypothetical protein
MLTIQTLENIKRGRIFMAFVYRSDRKIDLSGKENNTLLGPGRYVAHKPYIPKPLP